MNPHECRSCKAPECIYVWRLRKDPMVWTSSLDVACEGDYAPRPTKPYINDAGYCRLCAHRIRGAA